MDTRRHWQKEAVAALEKAKMDLVLNTNKLPSHLGGGAMTTRWLNVRIIVAWKLEVESNRINLKKLAEVAGMGGKETLLHLENVLRSSMDAIAKRFKFRRTFECAFEAL